MDELSRRVKAEEIFMKLLRVQYCDMGRSANVRIVSMSHTLRSFSPRTLRQRRAFPKKEFERAMNNPSRRKARSKLS